MRIIACCAITAHNRFRSTAPRRRRPSEGPMMATIEEALDIAIDHHASGRLAEAETIYSRILDVDPRNAPALHLAGVLACQTDRLDTALDRLGLAVREAPGMAAYRVDHAKALTAARRWSDVAAALRPALLVLAPDSAEGWYFLALAEHHSGGMDAAIAALEHACVLAPERGDMSGRLALLHQQRGQECLRRSRHTPALADFRRAAALLPEDAEMRFQLATALLESNRFEAAVDAYHQTLSLDPAGGFTLHNLGIASTRSGRMEEALTVLRRAARLDPGHIAVREALALMLAPRDPAEAALWAAEALALKGAPAIQEAPPAKPPLQSRRDGSAATQPPHYPPEVAFLPAEPGRPTLAERPCRHGVMRFFPQDAYVGLSLGLYGEYSDAEHRLAAMLAAAGDVVVEAGSNVGAHTVPLARTVGPTGLVHAFEPQRAVHDLLAHNLAANGLGNVVLHRAAVGNAPGHVTVPIPDYRRPGNFGAVSMGALDGEVVPVETIDGLGLERLALLKADVEGMEAMVVEGAVRSIARCRPALYLENDREEQSADLIAMLQGLGYRLWWHIVPIYNPANHAGNRYDAFPSVVSLNLLGLPEGRPCPMQTLPPVIGPGQSWREALTG
ncbi:FkbM family methyltransferase [Azospirillum brasilense]|nr:FkbM family methyltransferase [Azospirillum brasilense]